MNRHTAQLPDGSTAKRNSKNRIYPFCVAVRRSFEYDMARAQEPVPQFADNYRYYAEVEADPNHRHRSMQTEAARAIVRDHADAGSYMEAMRLKAVEAVQTAFDAGAYDKWSVVGWNGRRDLAEKLADQHRNERYAGVQIIETTIN